MASSGLPIRQRLATKPTCPTMILIRYPSLPCVNCDSWQFRSMYLLRVLLEVILASKRALLNRSCGAPTESMTVFKMRVSWRLQKTKGTNFGPRFGIRNSSPIKHAHPVRLRQMLTLFVSFPRSRAQTFMTECTLKLYASHCLRWKLSWRMAYVRNKREFFDTVQFYPAIEFVDNVRFCSAREFFDTAHFRCAGLLSSPRVSRFSPPPTSGWSL